MPAVEWAMLEGMLEGILEGMLEASARQKKEGGAATPLPGPKKRADGRYSRASAAATVRAA